MMKIYRMPNGITRQYEDGKAPDGAVLLEKAPVKSAEDVQNKAIETPKNKRRSKK